MLKSTHKSLPSGWTEHKAPSGHTYYYNAETKQSTYTRPTQTTNAPAPVDYNAILPGVPPFSVSGASGDLASLFGPGPNSHLGQSHFRGGRSYQDRSLRQAKVDRPKSKAAIPNCEPWVLVKTKLGRRFVYNSESNESFWKFPQDVMMAVIEMDKLEWEAKERGSQANEAKSSNMAEEAPGAAVRPHGANAVEPDDDSDSYEEVEVTDDEDEDRAAKRPHTDAESKPPGPVEFDEDDIAYQLAAMGEDDNLNPDEYDEDGEDYDEGLPLTEDDTVALFRDLLDDFMLNPYSPFEKVIEDERIVDDQRYTALPNIKTRRAVFNDWSRDRIASLQQQRAKYEQENAKKKDPRVSYLRFLHEYASLKLYWPEFKRKYKKESPMKDMSFSDKEREKLYREYIHILKRSEKDRKADLVVVLKNASKTGALSGASDIDSEALPEVLEKDLKFYGLPKTHRDELVRTYISTLPNP